MTEQFENFAEAQAPRLQRLAWLLTRDEFAAQDLLLKVYLKWTQVARADEPDVYVRRMLINLAKDRQTSRREWPRETVEPAARSDDRTHTADHTVLTRQVLITALDELSPQQRQVVAMRFFDDLSIVQTAQVLGCSQSTTRAPCSSRVTATPCRAPSPPAVGRS